MNLTLLIKAMMMTWMTLAVLMRTVRTVLKQNDDDDNGELNSADDGGDVDIVNSAALVRAMVMTMVNSTALMRAVMMTW